MNRKEKNKMKYRKIEAADDKRIAEIIRENLRRLHLDIPGTAYFDSELDHLSSYYNSDPDKRIYFIALDEDGQVAGGVGIAEFEGIEECAELQNSICMILPREKATEKNCCFWRKTGQGRLGIEDCILKRIPIFRQP